MFLPNGILQSEVRLASAAEISRPVHLPTRGDKGRISSETQVQR